MVIFSLIVLIIILEHGEKCFLRNFDFANLHHALFTGFLLFEQFALSRDIAAITFGKNIFAHRIDGFARNNLTTDSTLNWYLELMPRNGFTQFFANNPRSLDGPVFVNEYAERIDLLVIDQYREFDEFGLPVFQKLIIERGITFRYRFESVVEIEQYFAERQFENELNAA